MGRLSRTKGVAFEQLIAVDLRRALPRATIHRSSQADRPYNPDVVIEGDAPELARRLWLELEDSARPSPLDKLAQAERDSVHPRQTHLPGVAYPARLCVVVSHKKRARSIQATMRCEDWLEIVMPRDYMGVPLIRGIPMTIDWEQLLEVIRDRRPVEEAA